MTAPEENARVDEAPVDQTSEVPDTVQGGIGTKQFSTWEINTDLAGYLAEAVVADHLFISDEQTIWRGGNRRGVDIYAHFPNDVSEEDRSKKAIQDLAAFKIDAKHAYENDYLLDGQKQRVLSFFGSDRRVQAREEVTHYAFVVFDFDVDLSGNRVHVSDGAEVRVSASYRVRRLYLISAADVNRLFRKRENQKGLPTGLEQCAPLSAIEEFLVAGSAYGSNE